MWPLAAAFRFPEQVEVEWSIEIAASPVEVYARIVDYRKGAAWSPWGFKSHFGANLIARTFGHFF